MQPGNTEGNPHMCSLGCTKLGVLGDEKVEGGSVPSVIRIQDRRVEVLKNP